MKKQDPEGRSGEFLLGAMLAKLQDKKRTALEKIACNIRECTKCPLCSGREMEVPGEGDPNSKLFFIGEAPGVEEDKQGRPFVGKSGSLLSDLIRHIGLGRGLVFITNVVKCHPPGNRLPEMDEVNACLPYLREQISAVKPKIVVLLGNVALFSILKRTHVSELHGSLLTENGQSYFITCHPSAALRSGVWRRRIYEDFQKLSSFLQEMEEKIQWRNTS